MDAQTFRTYCKDRILPATIELNDKTYPNIPVKLPPVCCVDFKEDEIEITEVQPLTNKKEKEAIDSIPYSTVEKIEMAPIKKFMGIWRGTIINLDLKIFLKDSSNFHFECEAMSLLVELEAFLAEKNVDLIDSFDLVKTFQNAASVQEATEYLHNNLDEIAEKKGIGLLRLSQTEG